MLFPFLDQYVTAFNTVLASLGDFLISYFRHVVRHSAETLGMFSFLKANLYKLH